MEPSKKENERKWGQGGDRGQGLPSLLGNRDTYILYSIGEI